MFSVMSLLLFCLLDNLNASAWASGLVIFLTQGVHIAVSFSHSLNILQDRFLNRSTHTIRHVSVASLSETPIQLYALSDYALQPGFSRTKLT